MQSRVLNGAVILCLAIAPWCCGAESPGSAKKGRKAYLGAGAVVSSKPYVGVDTKVYPIPLFAYEGKRLYFHGIGAGYRLFNDKGLAIGPVIQPRFDGYEEDDSSALDGMDDRRLSIDAGVGLSWLTDVGLFGVSFVTDLLGIHDGQELDFSYAVLFRWGGFDFTPSVGVRWKSENLVDYYYGVRAEEAAFGRPSYQGNDAVDPYVRLGVQRTLGGKWSLTAGVECEWLDDDISDSPIVDDNYEVSFLVGILYSW